ncbi:hypothetical protein Y032_0649g1123 [Ancylostoma ceylanicum]|uniref:Uncharacterized protein n=1 Tax=Ancylostoma ceylanicum TaxID=53326 RepID=A0A016WK29_9BILA|nr:hypothetical protein Y032_0649g1123 [Ancylostoma ceylanicum]
MLETPIFSTPSLPAHFCIYCSPELRCVQTAAGIARAASDSHASICVEPALSDWVQLSPEGSSKNWLTTNQLTSMGYPVQEGYKPHLTQLPKNESPEDYLRRLSSFLTKISGSSESVVVVVANAHALEVARNRPWTTAEQLCQIKKAIRNCATCEVGVDSDNKVYAVEPLMLPFTKTLKDAQEKMMVK